MSRNQILVSQCQRAVELKPAEKEWNQASFYKFSELLRTDYICGLSIQCRLHVSLVLGTLHCSGHVKVPCSQVSHLQQSHLSGGVNPQQLNSQQKFLQLVKGPSQKKGGMGEITIAFMSLGFMSLQLLYQHLTVPYTFKMTAAIVLLWFVYKLRPLWISTQVTIFN